jgi:hypothetical protein
MAMDVAVVATTQRNSELVADLATERPALGKAQMVCIARLPAANQTGLLGYVADVVAIADPPRLGEGESGLVDRFSLPTPELLPLAFSLCRWGIVFALRAGGLVSSGCAILFDGPDRRNGVGLGFDATKVLAFGS